MNLRKEIDKYMKCVNGKEIKVMQSGAGFYLGTSCEYGGPYCRVSGYYPDAETAQDALEYGFELRQCMENKSCSGGQCVTENTMAIIVTPVYLN